MTWFKLDDKFHSHPKVLAAGNAAVGLYVRCGAYCCDLLTDGVIPRHVAMMYGTRANIDALLRESLWIRDGNDFRMPDFLEFNPSRERVLKERAEAAARQRARREKAGTKADSHSEVTAKSRRDSEGMSRCESHDPDPTRPDPSVTSSPTTSKSVVDEAAGGRDRLNAIADAYATQALALAKARTTVDNEDGYRRAARTTALTHDDLGRLTALFPTAPADVIAAALHGEKHSLQHYPRSDELADVVSLTDRRPA